MEYITWNEAFPQNDDNYDCAEVLRKKARFMGIGCTNPESETKQ